MLRNHSSHSMLRSGPASGEAGEFSHSPHYVPKLDTQVILAQPWLRRLLVAMPPYWTLFLKCSYRMLNDGEVRFA